MSRAGLPRIAEPLQRLLAWYYRCRARSRIRRHFPDSHFVGPYEKQGRSDAMWMEQWLWAHREWIRGNVLDMSTPRTWHEHLYQLPQVRSIKISNLADADVQKLGERSQADIVGDFCADELPVPEASFDTVLCLNVLEHCVDPAAMVRNIGRILRPGGHAFFACPFAYLDGHMSPDYWRFCRDGYLLLARQADLKVVEIGQFDDLVGSYFRRFGVRLDWGEPYRGIPVANWMIGRKEGGEDDA